MNSTNQKFSGRLSRQAREWFVLMQSGNVTAAQKKRFDAWLSAQPDHRSAYEQLEGISDHLAELSSTPEGAELRRSVESTSTSNRYGTMSLPNRIGRFRFNRSLGAAAGIGLAVIVAVLFWLPKGAGIAEEMRYVTGTREIRSLRLTDNTEIILGAQSELRTVFTADRRTLTLVSGEAFFDVMNDPDRPFVVIVNDVVVSVVGTKFDVRKRFDGASVAVLEGVVHVAGTSGQQRRTSSPLVLTAGQQISKPTAGQFETVKPIAAIEFGAWRNGRLIYKDAKLIDVITDANRYFDGSISLQVRELYDEKVTLSLRTDQVELLPGMLSSTLPLVASETSDKHIILLRDPNRGTENE